MSVPRTYHDGDRFPGRVGLTLADSDPAWPVSRRAPEGSPNVVLVVVDDVGFAQLGCFGSDIATPAFDRLAGAGLRYRSFHTTAMCSPTRACLLTGRNHHTCAMGGITDLAMGYPGFNGRIPKSCGFVSEVLRRRGWATFAVGKWHLAPADETHAAASRERWPLGQGFERFYGFLGGETNQFFPELVVDNSPIHFTPPGGYHLTEDLVDRAIGMVNDVRVADPSKPFFLYLALGACHAPHQAPREWIERYRGRFDDGWDAWRARTHERQLATGIIPAGTTLSPRPSWVQDWAALDATSRGAYARMMEVFAGFLSHTDHHVGRLVDFLAATGELDRTLVVLLSDNGASAEGGPHGTFNETELPDAGAEGVLLAQGGRFGGFSLYVLEGRAHYTYNFAGLEETTLSSPPLGAGRHVIGAELTPTRRLGMHAKLVVGGDVVAEADIPRTAPFRFALHGEGMCCGYDDGTPVSQAYVSPFRFTGVLHDVTVDVSGAPVADRVAEVQRAWMVQ